MSPFLLEHGDPIRLKPMTKDEKMCFASQDAGASPGFGRGGAKNFFFRFGKLHVAHALC